MRGVKIGAYRLDFSEERRESFHSSMGDFVGLCRSISELVSGRQPSVEELLELVLDDRFGQLLSPARLKQVDSYLNQPEVRRYLFERSKAAIEESLSSMVRAPAATRRSIIWRAWAWAAGGARAEATGPAAVTSAS